MAIFVQPQPFTGTNGTALTSFTGANGTTFTAIPGVVGGSNLEIQTNQVRCTGANTNGVYASDTPISADYTVEADFVIKTNGANYPGLCARVNTTTGARYMLIFVGSGNSGTFQFNKGTSDGSQLGSSSASQTMTAGTTQNVRFEVSGSTTTTLKAYLNDVEILSYDDSSSPITAAGKAGMQINSAGGASTGVEFDNFTAYTPVVPATAVTMSGPTSGTIGVASTNFTIGADGDITGTVTVTPSDSGAGGTFTPTTVNISSGSPAATFTYTPASIGTKTISVTNNGSLTNPSNISYAAQNRYYADNSVMVYSNLNWQDVSGSGSTSYRQTQSAGAYVKTAITVVGGGGGVVKVSVDPALVAASAISSTEYPRLVAYIDGVEQSLVQLVSGTTVYTLATGISAGSHQVEIFLASTSASTGNKWNTPTTSGSFIKFQGLILENASASAPTLKTKNGAAFGDSITEGTANLASGAGSLSQDASLSWPILLREDLDAEIGQIGFASTGWEDAGLVNVPNFATTWNKHANGITRTLPTDLDFIIINHGHNQVAGDFTDTIYEATGDTGVLKDIRAAVGPNTIILMISPVTGVGKTYVQNATTAYLTEYPTDRTAFIDGQVGFANHDGLHPSTAGDVTVAEYLAPLINAAIDSFDPLVAGTPSVTGTTSTTISLSATDASGGATPYTYQWQRSTTSGTGFSNISGATTRIYTDTGRTPSTTYYYRLVYTSATTETATSAETSGTTAAGSSSGTLTPGFAYVSAFTTTSLTLTAADAVGGTAPYTYQWHRSTTPGFTPSVGTQVSGATSKTLNNTGLTTGQSYYYRLAFTDATSTTVMSNQVTGVPSASNASANQFNTAEGNIFVTITGPVTLNLRHLSDQQVALLNQVFPGIQNGQPSGAQPVNVASFDPVEHTVILDIGSYGLRMFKLNDAQIATLINTLPSLNQAVVVDPVIDGR